MKHYHIISRIAIYLMAVILISFGIFQIKFPQSTMVYVPTSLPGGIIWASIVGAAFILVGISFITNQYVKITGYILAGLLLFFIITVHVPTYLNAGMDDMKQEALINILKDTAILAFILHIAAGAHHQHFHLEESD